MELRRHTVRGAYVASTSYHVGWSCRRALLALLVLSFIVLALAPSLLLPLLPSTPCSYVMLVGAYPFEDHSDPRNFSKTIKAQTINALRTRMHGLVCKDRHPTPRRRRSKRMPLPCLAVRQSCSGQFLIDLSQLYLLH